MIDCIVIPSWVLAVVGLVIFIPSVVFIILEVINIEHGKYTNASITVISTFGSALGAILFIINIAPYIPQIAWPCIQVIP
jgi:hypothetical protein